MTTKKTATKTTPKKTTKRAEPRPVDKLDLRVLAFRIPATDFAYLTRWCDKAEKTKTDAVVDGLRRIGALPGPKT